MQDRLLPDAAELSLFVVVGRVSACLVVVSPVRVHFSAPRV